MKNAQKLITDINKKVKAWDERSSFTLKGVRNLSHSDMDTLVLYANEYINNGGYSFGNLMDPLGEVKCVLDKYNIKCK